MNCRSFGSLALLIGAVVALAACATAPGPGSGQAPDSTASLLQVWSTPAGASIIVDGKPTGFRSPTSFPLPAGAHRITLSLAGHRNAEESVRLGPGDTVRVEAILAPLASGSLGVGSVPDGATILIDGVPFDQRTPTVIPQLVIGTHTVQLRLKGFADWSQAVVVTQSRTMELQARLAPTRSSRGTLAVQSQPPRAAIFLDGSATGKVTPERLTGIPPGGHRVELLLEGFRPWRGTAVVREGHIENLLVSLRHLPAQEVGGARIESDPPGACVKLNGVILRQRTPVDLAWLAPGAYPLEITRPDSHPWKGELQVISGKRALLQVWLEPDARSGSEGATTTTNTPLVPHPYKITVGVAAVLDGNIDLVFSATAADGAPASGVLELGVLATAGFLRETQPALVDGKARAVLVPEKTAPEITLSVALGSQCDTIVLRRIPGGWEAAAP